MDGLSALRCLRAAPETEATPVILVTTRAEPASVEQGWQAGCTDYIAKPIDAEELISKVRSCLGA
jgi:CheY-like chemotaxis protein